MSRLSAIQKKMWSRHSLAWSWPPSKWHELRTGSSFLQAPSVLSKEFHDGAWTNTFPSGESLRRWGESGRHREDRPFFGEILLAVGSSTLKTTRQCPTSTHATIADWFDIDPNARTGIVHKNLYILWIIAVMKNAVKIKRRLLRASLI